MSNRIYNELIISVSDKTTGEKEVIVSLKSLGTSRLFLNQKMDLAGFCDPEILATAHAKYIFETSLNSTCKHRGYYLETRLQQFKIVKRRVKWLPAEKDILGGQATKISSLQKNILGGYVAFLLQFQKVGLGMKQILVFLKIQGVNSLEDKITTVEVSPQVIDFRLVSDQNSYIAILLGQNSFMKRLLVEKQKRFQLVRAEKEITDQDLNIKKSGVVGLEVNTVNLKIKNTLKYSKNSNAVDEKKKKLEKISRKTLYAIKCSPQLKIHSLPMEVTRKFNLDSSKKGKIKVFDLYKYFKFEGYITGITFVTHYDELFLSNTSPKFGTPKVNSFLDRVHPPQFQYQESRFDSFGNCMQEAFKTPFRVIRFVTQNDLMAIFYEHYPEPTNLNKVEFYFSIVRGRRNYSDSKKQNCFQIKDMLINQFTRGKDKAEAYSNVVIEIQRVMDFDKETNTRVSLKFMNYSSFVEHYLAIVTENNSYKYLTRFDVMNNFYTEQSFKGESGELVKSCIVMFSISLFSLPQNEIIQSQNSKHPINNQNEAIDFLDSNLNNNIMKDKHKYINVNIEAELHRSPGSSRINFWAVIQSSASEYKIDQPFHYFILDYTIVDYLFLPIKINNFVLIVLDSRGRIHLQFFVLSEIEKQDFPQIYNIGSKVHQLKYGDFLQRSKEQNNTENDEELKDNNREIQIYSGKIAAFVKKNNLIIAIGVDNSAFSFAIEAEFELSDELDKDSPKKVEFLNFEMLKNIDNYKIQKVMAENYQVVFSMKHRLYQDKIKGEWSGTDAKIQSRFLVSQYFVFQNEQYDNKYLNRNYDRNENQHNISNLTKLKIRSSFNVLDDLKLMIQPDEQVDLFQPSLTIFKSSNEVILDFMVQVKKVIQNTKKGQNTPKITYEQRFRSLTFNSESKFTIADFKKLSLTKDTILIRTFKGKEAKIKLIQLANSYYDPATYQNDLLMKILYLTSILFGIALFLLLITLFVRKKIRKSLTDDKNDTTMDFFSEDTNSFYYVERQADLDLGSVNKKSIVRKYVENKGKYRDVDEFINDTYEEIE